MKLSDFTMTVLKNFSQINSGIVIESGNKLRTMNAEKSILAEAELEDSFSCKFGIYDLVQFLGNVNALGNPDLKFDSKSVEMTDGNLVLKYFSCATDLIVTPPNKKLEIGDPDVSFILTHSTLTKLLRLANMNGLSNLSVIGKDGGLFLQSHDKSNDTSNFALVKIDTYSGEDFTATFKTENLKLLQDDYSVDLKKGKFARFSSQSKKLTYFIALETK